MKMIFITLLTAFFLYASPCIAVEPTNPSVPSEVPVYTGNDRPKSGGAVLASNVRCFYSEGILTIEFETQEGIASLDVTSVTDGEIISTSFDTSTPAYINVGSEEGNYILVIKTSKTYYGYFTLE